MDDHMSHSNHHCCNCKSSTAAQTLDEMEFERGIWSAALYNDLDRLNTLIGRGDVNRRDNSCYTALHYAARQNNVEACKKLIDSGADVDAQTNGGVTALHRACSMGCEAVVNLLLRHSASTAIVDSDGYTALHRAAAGGHATIARQLLDIDPSLCSMRSAKNAVAWDLVPVDQRTAFEAITRGYTQAL